MPDPELAPLESSLHQQYGDEANHRHGSKVKQALKGLWGFKETSDVEYLGNTSAESQKDPIVKKVEDVQAVYETAIDNFFGAEGLKTFSVDSEWRAEMQAAKNYKETLSSIKWQLLSPEQTNQLLESLFMTKNKQDSFYGTQPFDNPEPIFDPLTVLATMVPPETTRKLYDEQLNDNETLPVGLGKILRYTDLTDKEASAKLMRVLDGIYSDRGGVRATEAGQDQLVDSIYAKYDAFTVDMCTFPEAAPENASTEETSKFNSDCYYRIRAIFADCGLRDQLALDFIGASWSRLSYDQGKPTKFIRPEAVLKDMNHIRSLIDTVGSEKVQAMHDKLGVTNLDYYSEKEVTDLAKLLDRDADFVEQVKAGNTTIGFRDASGDYNGAFQSMNDIYDHSDGNTFIFDVQQPSDFYRRMIFLKQLGIQPSTLVIGAHGSPGSTWFGNKYEGGFRLRSESEGTDPESNDLDIMLGMANLGRLVGPEFMQPRKTTSEGDESIGRIQIIVNSCSSDVAPTAGSSIAASIVEGINKPIIDVYGAGDVMAASKDETGNIMFNAFKGDRMTYKNTTRKLTIQGGSQPVEYVPISGRRAA